MTNPFETEIVDRLMMAVTALTGEAARQEEIASALTTPPNPEMGDSSFPCFTLAKALRRKPNEVASDLCGRLAPGGTITRVQAVGPYVNFHADRRRYVEWLLRTAHDAGADYGHSNVGRGRTVVVEYSSPNIAKHLGIHHVRTTMIGNALDKIHRALGYTVVSINFLGDWGTQFGILIAAYKKWGGPETFEGDPVANLNALYVRFNEEAETNPALRDEGRAWFRRLEEGDAEAAALWRRFREVSLAAFEEVYRRLHVTFDVVSGESVYDALMPGTIRRLTEMGLAVEDQGALIVDLKPWKMPPVLLRKSDGATLYDTRDVAAALDRWERYHFARMIYVVGGDQKLHFRQIFKVLERMGCAWAKDCVHVDFGIIRLRGKDGVAKMSTRRGQVVMLKDVLGEAVERVRRTIEEKNPALADKESVAEAVGVGAVIFNDLKRQRVKDVDFDWDSVLSFEGETGPYVQYTHVRLCGILRKYGKPVTADVNYDRLAEPEEFHLARALADFGSVIERAAAECEPSVVSQYLLALCSRFNSYYHQHTVVGDDPELTAARVLLMDALRQTIRNGLDLLGMQTPEEM